MIQNLYSNLSYIYPRSDIWIIGHSLGGALGSLLGVTFGVPVVTFEAPGERMASQRLHLPSPVFTIPRLAHFTSISPIPSQPSTHHVTHVYHTADPVPMGTCNGVLSSCSITGFAMESRCHLGKTIVYDTVSNLSWSVDLRSHPIANMIETILADPWPPAEELGREVPEAVPQGDDCVVSDSSNDVLSSLPRSSRTTFYPVSLINLPSLIADTGHTGMLQLGVWGF